MSLGTGVGATPKVVGSKFSRLKWHTLTSEFTIDADAYAHSKVLGKINLHITEKPKDISCFTIDIDYFLINNIAIVPWQLLYFYLATNVDFLSEIFINFGIDLSIVRFLSIISITSIAVLFVRVLFTILKKTNLIKYIETNFE